MLKIKHTAGFWSSMLAFPNKDIVFTVFMQIMPLSANRKTKGRAKSFVLGVKQPATNPEVFPLFKEIV
jgi:hypothetical protein